MNSKKYRENDDLVDTDIGMQKNVGKNTELSTSNSVARKLTKIQMKMLTQKKKYIF